MLRHRICPDPCSNRSSNEAAMSRQATPTVPVMDARRLLREVKAGLEKTPREVPPRFFYDERGSRLFEDITRLPEYYLTRTERALLRSRGAEWTKQLAPRSLIEPGAGSADKTRVLLDAASVTGESVLYVPIDVSAKFLEQTARQLSLEYPHLSVEPIVADITRPLPLPDSLPRPALFGFLGSTIGNFDDVAASRLLGDLRRHMEPRDRLLLGADLKKDRTRLEAAYNDSAGVTAAFNANMLEVLNRTFGADFDRSAFEHEAVYDADRGRIEMYLISKREQSVRFPGIGRLSLDKGERIRTEVSNKYDHPRLRRILGRAGLRIERWATDAQGLYALLLASPAR